MGTELLLGAVLGFVILGPKRMYDVLGYVGKAKSQFDKASRELKSHFTREFSDSATEWRARGPQSLKCESEARRQTPD
jgi:Sec-independent protein translocase protein TatA